MGFVFDVIVIGGGPAGLYSARLCEQMGYRTVVIEEDREIGKPPQCSGLISSKLKRFFPEIQEWGVVENEVDSAILHSRRSELVLRKTGAAYVIDRQKFDKKLSDLIESDIRTGCRAERITLSRDSVNVRTSRGDLKGEIVLGCDGPNSTTGRGFAGMGDYVKGLIAIIKGENRAENVDLYFDKGAVKDGFFWRIPRGESTEYGVWGREVGFSDIEGFFGIRDYRKSAGMIPVRPVKKSYSDRVLLVGDAAGQVKPWSGGGVIYGLTCARIAAGVMEKAFGLNDFSGDVLKEYESMWRRKIGRQLKLGMIFRRLLKCSTDFQLDLSFRAGGVLDYGRLDMDFII